MRHNTSTLARILANATILLMSFGLLMATAAQAQSFNVLYTFVGNGSNGAPYYPASGLVLNTGGKLIGTALRGGTTDNGAVFQLSHVGAGWVLGVLYSFEGGSDGANPYAGVTIGPSGVLYGTTSAGGDPSCGFSNGCGTIYSVRPPASAPKSVEQPWQETVLYRFQGSTDGLGPGGGRVVFDSAGNLYGTTEMGGDITDCSFNPGCGVVYELSSAGQQSVLHAFNPFSGGDGNAPWGGVVFDSTGSLYGTTTQDPILYQLSPNGGGSWTENILYSFVQNPASGNDLYTSLLYASGNFYGVAQSGGMSGVNGGGTVFKYSAGELNVLYDFGTTRMPTSGAEGPLIMDAAGNLYGVSQFGGTNGVGNVYKLSPSGGGYAYTDLYDFTGLADGALPDGNLVMDSNGNLYGTTCCGGGSRGDLGGVIFEITP